MERLKLQMNEQKALFYGGFHVKVESLSQVEMHERPSETSIHEAQHTLAAILLGVEVHYMTNISEGDSLGHMVFSKCSPEKDAIISAAPHALGSGGTGADLDAIEDLGQSISSACSAARALLLGREEEILALATALDQLKRLPGAHCATIVESVEEERHIGEPVLVTLTAESGDVYIVRTHIKEGTLQFSEKDLPRHLLTSKKQKDEKTVIPVEISLQDSHHSIGSR